MTIKNEMSFLQDAWRDLRFAMPQFAGFQILFKLFGLMFFTPLSVAVTAELLKFSGYSSVTNYQLIAFALNPLGWLTVLSAGTFLFFGIYLETSGLALIAARLRGQTRLSSFQAVRLMIRKLPGLLATAVATFASLLACTAPFMAAGGITYWLLTRAHDINYYMAEQPPLFICAVIFALALTVGMIWVVVRACVLWIFVVPAALFEGRIGLAALRRSRDLARGALRRTLAALAMSAIVFSLVSGVVAIGIGALTGMALTTVDDRLGLGVVLVIFIWGIHITLTALVTLVFVPLTVVQITRLYFELRERTEGIVKAPEIFARVPGRPAGHAMPFSRWLIFGVVMLLLSAMVAATALLAGAAYETDSVKVIAHRGDPTHAPENTLSSLRKALELHAEYAEIDLQETSDGAILVLHDNDLMRVAREPRGLWQMTFDEARKLEVGAWFAPEFKGEQLPTLDEVIDLTDGRMRMIFELKYNGHDQRLPERVVEIIQRRNFQNQCIISSLNYKGLQRVKELDPTIQTVFIMFGGIGNLASLKSDGIGMTAMFLKSDLVKKCHENEKQVFVWTVNDPAKWEKFIEMDVDFIYTDKPGDLIELLKRRAALSPGERIRQIVMEMQSRE